MEAAQAASVSHLEELLESAASTSTKTAGQDQALAGHAAEGPTVEVKEPEVALGEEETEASPPSSSAKSPGQNSIFSTLTFPQKLWVLAESENVESIWWGHGGKCLVIDEQLFVAEVLAKESPIRAFRCTAMKSFIHQLNDYGFTRVPQNMERSPHLPEFLAEEKAIAAHRKLFRYSCPLFRRDNPCMLQSCKRRPSKKRRAAAALGPDLQDAPHENPQRSSQGAQPVHEAAAGPDESLQGAEQQDAQAAAPVGPPPAKLCKTDTPGAPAGTATAPASPHSALPFVPPAFTPGPTQQQLPQASQPPQLQALWEALSSFISSLAMAMRAAAMTMPPQWQSCTAPHCSTCSCSQLCAALHCATCSCSQHGADAAPGTSP
ncbi:heat shock transcription factor, Y-linked-like [Cyrtonyx montezumae]|uniref:heat shock transcription factor, Y-linked-like n=1 Tax=Cyrtonyx montezumae TaxID=9017 RepID=UPI0032DA9FB8